VMTIEPAFGPLAPGPVAQLNNICQVFDLAPLGIATSQVTFEYLDYGGTENLQINGSSLLVGDLDTFSGMLVGGVFVDVVTSPYGGGVYGEVTLTGDVQRLRVGGQEFWMDDLCVVRDTGGDECDHLVSHASLALGDLWGVPVGTPPGTLIFAEDGIPVRIGQLDAGSVITYNYCEVVPPFVGVGVGQMMQLNNVTNTYETSALGHTVASVHFVFLDQGGIENLQVNGAPRYVGDLEFAPPNIAPGVTCAVNTWMVPAGLAGEVILTGDVQRLSVGGQEFFIDEVCVMLDHSTAVDQLPVALGVSLQPNVPNPFNPVTMLRFNLSSDDHVDLSVYDLAGRRVRTLVDERRAAGEHRVLWDGRDDGGRAAPAGVYLVRVASRHGDATQRIALIK